MATSKKSRLSRRTALKITAAGIAVPYFVPSSVLARRASRGPTTA